MKKIAIIDDNIVFRKLTKIAFEHQFPGDLEVFLFENGQEAVTYITMYLEEKEKLPKLILLDLDMPVMDGWEFLDIMLPINKEKNLELVIYIVTSSSDATDMERAQQMSDVKGYLIKPINVTQVASLIKEI